MSRFSALRDFIDACVQRLEALSGSLTLCVACIGAVALLVCACAISRSQRCPYTSHSWLLALRVLPHCRKESHTGGRTLPPKRTRWRLARAPVHQHVATVATNRTVPRAATARQRTPSDSAARGGRLAVCTHMHARVDCMGTVMCAP